MALYSFLYILAFCIFLAGSNGMDVESESEKEKELILGGGELVGRSGGWLYIPLCTLL